MELFTNAFNIDYSHIELIDTEADKRLCKIKVTKNSFDALFYLYLSAVFANSENEFFISDEMKMEAFRFFKEDEFNKKRHLKFLTLDREIQVVLE